jgi:hypothetical protein
MSAQAKGFGRLIADPVRSRMSDSDRQGVDGRPERCRASEGVARG